MKKTWTLLLWLCVFTFVLNAEEKKKTICVNMIVKDETKVITRCLESVRPIIDYWVIVDTGSRDGTQQMIKEYMKDVPGELHETPWKNFGYNRNDALMRARGKADYVLIIDADEVLSIPENFQLPELDKDFYHIITKFGGMEYARVQLINNHLDWQWKGVLHEYLDCPRASTSATLPDIRNVVHTDGARSQDPLKYKKDADLLEVALKEEPDNSRYVFYLAQSYRDFGDNEKALENYEKRIAMGGWNEEVFISKLRVAQLKEALDRPHKEVIKAYYDAYHERNVRAEPLYYLASYYRRNNEYAAATLTASIARTIPYPAKDLLFVEKWVYDWGVPFELSINAYWVGRYEDADHLNTSLLSKSDLPESIRDAVIRNSGFTKAKLLEFYTPQGILKSEDLIITNPNQ